MFIDHYDSSFSKTSICGCCLLITVSPNLRLMFADYATLNTWLKQYQLSSGPVRLILIASCVIIYSVRFQLLEGFSKHTSVDGLKR